MCLLQLHTITAPVSPASTQLLMLPRASALVQDSLPWYLGQMWIAMLLFSIQHIYMQLHDAVLDPVKVRQRV